MATYFLGIDVGGTKSHALIADQNGQVVGFAQGGPGNPENVGYDGLAQRLHTITQAALHQAGLTISDIAGAGFGIGGYDWPSQREPILQAIGTIGLNVPVELVNDALIALLAGASQGWGVAVVAGTSCNAWGLDQFGKQGRMTGMGSWTGEGAGADELVEEAIKAVALAWTQRGPVTRLTQMFINLTQAQDVADLLEGLGNGRYQLKGAAAPAVFQVAANGDTVAHNLILWAGRELGSMANGIIRQLDLGKRPFEIILSGSFYSGSPLLIEVMHQVIHSVAPNAQLIRLNTLPVMGGVLLGCQQGGINPVTLRPSLLASTQKMQKESER